MAKRCWLDENVLQLMKATLEAINQMQADGVIGPYAIGGAVGATFYLAPAATVDLNVFVTLPSASKLLVSLSPYEYLQASGGKVQDEYILIGEWPVQFLTPGDELEQEAVAQAITTRVEGTVTRVMSAEHLMAIALKTGRAKDHNRILQFVEQVPYDPARLTDILDRRGLNAKWQTFQSKFLREQP